MNNQLNEAALEAAKKVFWNIHAYEDSDRSLIAAIQAYLVADDTNKRLRDALEKLREIGNEHNSDIIFCEIFRIVDEALATDKTE